MRLLDLFLPRIMLGKASWSTPRPDAPSASDQAIATADKGFSYLKRDLVRLVGALAYENRMAQDRIRAHNGITVIMNMCVADERNPCTSCLSNPMQAITCLTYVLTSFVFRFRCYEMPLLCLDDLIYSSLFIVVLLRPPRTCIVCSS